jgi:hypothetical protein
LVVELKVRASETEAREDYEKLATMCDKLKYPLGVFINIDATTARREVHVGSQQDKLFGFAVSLVDGAVSIVGLAQVEASR